ncbi:unnamed protein product [Chilo suppressalis]|uniref:LITAF domain-containing protein n=1 Tax=Chilo suppressalis TaxID=168631 RepID=A0ABN8EGD9_CHISP|nr:unnamed protein product [Chilo suppressalis]
MSKDGNNTARCSHGVDETNTIQISDHTGSEAVFCNEICTNAIDLSVEARTSNISAPKPPDTASVYSYYNDKALIKPLASAPFIIISRPPSVIARPSSISHQIRIPSDLPSATSFTRTGQPQSLFLQALSKLNETSLSKELAKQLNIQQITDNTGRTINIIGKKELSTPDSLTSAPPSYSFVLRQMALRRRPRIIGTFVPSPSFVQHTPPPNYAAAFDIYVDTPIPPAPRAYNFGFVSMPVICPECGYAGMTMVISKITICTHLCAVILCLLCCWVCAPLPYILRSCKDVYHYCRNCRNFLGIYRPTNPENGFS